jgi:gas vesicle protein
MKEESATPIRQNSILVPLLVGGIVGAALGILLAPKPGHEMRKQIKDFTGDAKDKLSSAIGKGREFYDEAKVVVSNAVDAGKQAYVQERGKYETAH